MDLRNEIMLITYADSMGRNLNELNTSLTRYFKKAVRGVHILPFFPSSGDRGFAPLGYTEVDKSFGDWGDIHTLAEHFYLMYDFMANHISKESIYFKDYQKNKEYSPYKDLFIQYSKFWTNGAPTEKQIDLIYKRKPKAPYYEIEFEDGSKEKLWCTFSDEQIDLDVKSETTKKFFEDNLAFLCNHHASIIRVDAFAYVTKKENTNCFFIEPDVWECLEYIDKILHAHNALLLPEIHEHYSIQLKIAERGYYVYDFALPMLVLHALYSGKNYNLINWLRICPRKQFTTLDTHDGIGVVDVVDLMSQEDIEFTKEKLYSEGANVKRVYSSEKYNNLDIYQINCTYYSALGDNDKAYLLARAIQFFSPGIPQVYYVGLLAGKNDIELLERTKNGRDINRHNYTLDEISQEVERPVVKSLTQLMEFRNTYKVFDGEFEVNSDGLSHVLELCWRRDELFATLKANLETHEFEISYVDSKTKEHSMLELMQF